jgi:hypothetical protein
MRQNKKTSVFILSLLLCMSAFQLLLPQLIVRAHTPPWNIPTQTVIGLTPNPVGVGQTTTITLGLTEAPPTAIFPNGDRWSGFIITIAKPDGTKEYLGPFISNTSGLVTVQYTPTMIGNYSFSASFNGQILLGTNTLPGNSSEYIGDYYQPSTSNPISMIVQQQPVSNNPLPTPMPTDPVLPTPHPTPVSFLKTPTTISVACQSLNSNTRFKVTITGTLSSPTAGVPGADILLSYSINDGAYWVNLATASTDINGNFTATWNTLVTGNYQIKATYVGNSNYSESSNIVSFCLVPAQENIVFSVASNSTITNLQFDSTGKQLSFNTNGTSGTVGYVNVKIPSSLISDISNLKVSVDGKSVVYSVYLQDAAWIVGFSYHQSSHDVTIALRSVSGDSQLGIWLIVGVVAAVAVVAVAITVIWRRK